MYDIYHALYGSRNRLAYYHSRHSKGISHRDTEENGGRVTIMLTVHITRCQIALAEIRSVRPTMSEQGYVSSSSLAGCIGILHILKFYGGSKHVKGCLMEATGGIVDREEEVNVGDRES